MPWIRLIVGMLLCVLGLLYSTILAPLDGWLTTSESIVGLGLILIGLFVMLSILVSLLARIPRFVRACVEHRKKTSRPSKRPPISWKRKQRFARKGH